MINHPEIASKAIFFIDGSTKLNKIVIIRAAHKQDQVATKMSFEDWPRLMIKAEEILATVIFVVTIGLFIAGIVAVMLFGVSMFWFINPFLRILGVMILSAGTACLAVIFLKRKELKRKWLG